MLATPIDSIQEASSDLPRTSRIFDRGIDQIVFAGAENRPRTFIGPRLLQSNEKGLSNSSDVFDQTLYLINFIIVKRTGKLRNSAWRLWRCQLCRRFCVEVAILKLKMEAEVIKLLKSLGREHSMPGFSVPFFLNSLKYFYSLKTASF